MSCGSSERSFVEPVQPPPGAEKSVQVPAGDPLQYPAAQNILAIDTQPHTQTDTQTHSRVTSAIHTGTRKHDTTHTCMHAYIPYIHTSTLQGDHETLVIHVERSFIEIEPVQLPPRAALHMLSMQVPTAQSTSPAHTDRHIKHKDKHTCIQQNKKSNTGKNETQKGTHFEHTYIHTYYKHLNVRGQQRN